jgi:hypothetical protein
VNNIPKWWYDAALLAMWSDTRRPKYEISLLYGALRMTRNPGPSLFFDFRRVPA